MKAFAYKGEKKTYVAASPAYHCFTSGGASKYTNPKSVTVNKTSVTLKKAKTFRIKAKVNKLSGKKTLIPKGHSPALRYISSDKTDAEVSPKARALSRQ